MYISPEFKKPDMLTSNRFIIPDELVIIPNGSQNF